jgi:hypothetical protein
MSTLTNENGGRPSLADKLLACDAISSLDQELRIARILRALKWQANVGHYYNDPVEGKDRELDIFASQR